VRSPVVIQRTVTAPKVAVATTPKVVSRLAEKKDPEQAVLPHSSVTDVLASLRLGSSDVYCDIGCGDGRLLVAAVRRYRCKAIGVEIDPDVARTAIANVKKAEADKLIPEGSVTVVVQDARYFDPVRYKVTAGSAFLFPNTLEVLKPVLSLIPRLAVPFHEIPGEQPTDKYMDVNIYSRSVADISIDNRFRELFGSR